MIDARVSELLAPLRQSPSTAGILTDFDGTISKIVPDASDATPVPGAVELLHELAHRYGVVAVVSGRPASFLSATLQMALHGSPLRAIGLYGMEEVGPDGRSLVPPEFERWRPVVARVADEAEASLPAAVDVERKGLGATIHWRRAPEHEAEAQKVAAALATAHGLSLRHGRMAVEMTAPGEIDKGGVVARLCEDLRAATYLGDDTGDIVAFETLTQLHRRRGLHAVKLAVADAETPADLVAAADFVLGGPMEALEALRWLNQP